MRVQVLTNTNSDTADRDTGPRSTSRSALYVLLCLALLGLASCEGQPVESATEQPATPPTEEAPANEVHLGAEAIKLANIQSAPVETAALSETIEAPARITLDQDRTARVGSFVEGVIRECCLTVGSAVKKDQSLARLHSHSGHDAESDYLQSLAQLQSRKSELEYAEQTHQRASRLHELKAGSLQSLQDAATQLERAATAVTHAEAEVQRTEHHLNFLGLPLPTATPSEEPDGEEHDHLITVRSPQDGTVMERHTTQGAVVTPSDTLYVISNLSQLWAIAQVPERHLGVLRRSMTVELRVEAYPGRRFPARITQISDALDPESRTVQVRCVVSNSGRALKTEMFATVSIPVGNTDPVTVVPVAALQPIDGVDTVFVERAAGSFEVRPVTTGRRSASLIEILNGLNIGERVVVEGAFHLKSERLKSRMGEE